MTRTTRFLRRFVLAALALTFITIPLTAWAPGPKALPVNAPGSSPAPSPAGDAANDVALLRLVVEAAETTASGTASAVRFRARVVVAALESSGVTFSQIETGEIDMVSVLERPRVGSSRRPSPPPRVIGYRAWISITVTTPAIQRVDYLVDRAAGAGASLEWVEYREVEEDPEEPADTPT